ncbi:SRPBCC family protein [Nocardia xishanensis]|uniref:SRPBCC family protein n=1 Tax=Nocardia xishanensis TaxID=238964 RepID=UPI00340DC148
MLVVSTWLEAWMSTPTVGAWAPSLPLPAMSQPISVSGSCAAAQRIALVLGKQGFRVMWNTGTVAAVVIGCRSRGKIGQEMRVEVRKIIDNSIDKVWTSLSDFGSPHLVDESITLKHSAGRGVGAVRTIELASGGSATELCTVCDPETFTLVYTILPPADVPLKNYVSTVRLRWVGPGRTEVHWVQVSEFTADDRFPVTEDEFAAHAGQIYSAFIDGLERAR